MNAALAALLLVAGFACRHQTGRTARFRVRPDSASAGSLAGPFDGRVVDAATGNPVAGALVYATWTYQAGYGVTEPSGVIEAVSSTDAGGRYSISSVDNVRTCRGKSEGSCKEQSLPDGRLADFHLVIYKRGYVAYRSDMRFSDLMPRYDFAQRNNRVVLERWRSDLSHARHLRYVGGGSAISALTAWEVAEASQELSGQRGVEGPRLSSDLLAGLGSSHLVAAQLLGSAEIKSVTGYDGGFESGPLNDQTDTATYTSQHFRALGQPEMFDVALRLWHLDPPGAEKQYSELLELLPRVEERTEAGDLAFFSAEGDIFGYGFLDRSRGVVVLLTCGKAQCKDKNQVLELVEIIESNIAAVVPQGGAKQ
jgi:hypothetical protein